MTMAFVLPGESVLGAVQVGMAEALFEAGIRPDLIVGKSAGAAVRLSSGDTVSALLATASSPVSPQIDVTAES